MIGRKLAHYEVLDKIGEGGMGEVYRARDTSLDRDVAIKVLPAALVADPERTARFEREAKVLASLNHPGIAAVYGFHEHDGTRFLAMELVPGPDLAQRLARGPIPAEEALPVASRIAQALEYAHERGIIHRDLKPANIKVTPDGVKILDFGLAKALDPEGAAGEPTSTPTMLPTVTSGGTRAGIVLGTAAYMSPEQARGQQLDRRTDIWAFGCVLYEMLTGKLLFPGETVSDTIAAVLRADIDLSALPGDTPESVRQLLARCLDRDPATRLRDVGEARVLLGDPRTSSLFMAAASDVGPAAPPPARRWPWLAGFAAVLVLGFAGGRLLTGSAPETPPDPALRFEVHDSTLAYGSLALSPDGSRLVFARRTEDGGRELCVRSLDGNEVRVLPGSQGGHLPFWSPDGGDVGFFIGMAVHRVALGGGSARQIATLPDRPMGGTWNAEGVILAGTFGGPIFRIPAAGGSPDTLTRLDAPVEDAHVWPAFLPDGEHFVFLTDASTTEGHRLTVGSVKTGKTEVLRTGDRSAFFVEPRGALLYIDARQLMALPFDMDRREITGPAVQIDDEIQTSGQRHETPITISANGVIALQRGSDEAIIVSLPLDGSPPEQLLPTERYRNPRLSPDGRTLAYEIQISGGERLLWIQDLERGSRTLISERGVMSDSPAWSPDGEWLYFGTGIDDRWTLHRKRVLGGGPPEALGSPEGSIDMAVLDCSPDGRWILAGIDTENGNYSLYLCDLEASPLAWTTWLDTPAVEEFARFSADGRWIAFESNASGQNEIYVAPVDGGPSLRQWMVSVNGGVDPAWGPAGDVLYYRSPAGVLHAVPFRVADGELRAAAPEPVLEVQPPEVGYLRNAYDLTPDGKAIIAFVPAMDQTPAIQIRTGWRAW